MTDQPVPPHEEEEATYPWDADPPAEEEFGPDGLRHDAFTARRKHEFLQALVKSGSIEDACRATGVGRRTVYRHQEDDPLFLDHCRVALRMSAAPIELTAWSRAVEGVEQEFACGGQVHVRRRYDGGLLRLLLQGSNPKKYGRNPGFTRKRILKFERKQMERDIRAEVEDRMRPRPLAEVRDSILRKIEAIERQAEGERLAEGWTRSSAGDWVPPGYAPVPGWAPPGLLDAPAPPAAPDESGAVATDGGTPRDSV
jgi:hypothetical protein